MPAAAHRDPPTPSIRHHDDHHDDHHGHHRQLKEASR
jgi:hypothetical protein